MCNLFRLLEARDIECRVAQTGMGKKGAWASILLYKDARVDQRVMDDTFGAMNWQADYELIAGNLYCKVSVWDKEKGCWVTKMNVGTESNTEAEKGQASDALKRACFTWGLGVELYSAPKIFINLGEGEYTTYVKDGKNVVKGSQLFKLTVDAIEYDSDRKVSYLRLKDQNGTTRYEWGSASQNKPIRGENRQEVRYFTADNGRSATKGGKIWQDAVKKMAAGVKCNDGMEISDWFGNYYNVPEGDMKDFLKEVEEAKRAK